MAETKTKATEKTTDTNGYVPLLIPRIPQQKADQTAFISVNFKNYLVKRGETVMVPPEVKETWDAHVEAEARAFEFAEENGVREP